MNTNRVANNPVEGGEVVFKKKSQLKEIWRRFRKNKTAMIGLAVLVVLLALTLGAELIIPYEAGIQQNLVNRNQSPSAEHWFGTDAYGRDLFARCIHGARYSLGIGLAATFTSLLIGLFFGSTVAYWGGVYESVVMRLLDVFAAIPSVLLALSIVAALGPSVINIIIAITITRMGANVRIVRSSVMPISNMDYVEAANAGGTSDFRIIMKHILPNALGPILVQTTMSISMIILQVSSLSFLGLGISAPTPEWGVLISEARQVMRLYPTQMIFPGLFIIFTALSFNLVGDGLRDALDPKLKT